MYVFCKPGQSLIECYGCGVTQHQGLKLCSGCKKAAYCSVDCQTRHWKQSHKAVCKKKEKKQEEVDDIEDGDDI